jgi:hypothetical protein
MNPVAPARRFPMGIYWLLLGLIAVIALLPLVTTLTAVGVAEAYGCQISEGLRTPCIIDGQDWGELLQFGGISFWYLLLTWPVAFVLFVAWLVVLLIHRARYGKAAR